MRSKYIFYNVILYIMDVKTKRTKLHEAFPYLRETNLLRWNSVQHTLDAHNTRAQMLEYRKRIMEKQRKMNLSMIACGTLCKRRSCEGIPLRDPSEDRRLLGRTRRTLRSGSPSWRRTE